MPIRYDKDSETWCYGSKCGYKSREDAEKVAQAIHAQENKKKIEDAELEVFGKVLLESSFVKKSDSEAPKNNELKVGDKLVDVSFCKIDEEKQLVYGIVYEPDVVDAQGDFAESSDIEKACHQFMLDYQQIGHMHTDILDSSFVKIVENYIVPQDMLVGNDRVRKGTWVMVTKVFDKDLWEKIKKGELGGFSMAGYCIPTEKVDRKYAEPINIEYQWEDTMSDWFERIKKCKEVIEKVRGEGMGVGGARQGDGGASECVCTKCGHMIKHERGIPCNQVSCPKCGSQMIGKVWSDEARAASAEARRGNSFHSQAVANHSAFISNMGG